MNNDCKPKPVNKIVIESQNENNVRDITIA